MKNPLLLLTTTLAFVALGQSTPAQTLLSVDVNDRTVVDTPNTVTGFLSYTLNGTTATVTAPSQQTVGSYSVTLAPFDDGLDENTVTNGLQNTTGAIDDRDRTTPTNGVSLTYAQIYDDFVFAGASTGPSGGMNLTISGGALLPNTQYLISIYSFDSGSTAAPQPRTANWLDGNNGDALVLTTSFSGGTAPVNDGDYRFTGLATTDGAGSLFLKGRNTTGYQPDGAVSPSVFLNGFEVSVVPEPSSVVLTMIGIGAFALRRRR